VPFAGQVIKPLVKLGKRADDCWEWLGPKCSAGHGKKTFNGRDVLAHRWMWEQLFGPIPDGLVVFTTCENKGCINPHHFACGTQAQACRWNESPAEIVCDLLNTTPAAPALPDGMVLVPKSVLNSPRLSGYLMRLFDCCEEYAEERWAQIIAAAAAQREEG
jgi:hypothetical protein